MSRTMTPEAAPAVPDTIDPAVWRTVAVVLIGGIAVLFDTTIVAVALRTLATDLHTSVTTIQWVTTGYLLAMGVTIPIAGWAQRVIGGKRLWLIALGLFLAGSVLSSLAWSAGSLIGFRVLQGVGGGIMLPLMSTLVMQAAGGHALGRIMAVVGLPAALGPILGPVVGGVILQNLHWSWMFWVNVPFCVAGIALAATVLPADGPVRRIRLDVPGFGLMAAALVGVLWGLSNAGKTGGFGRADVVAPLVAGTVLLVVFVGWSIRRRGRSLVDLGLLAHRPLASASLLLFLASGALYGAMLLLPLYFQELRGSDVLAAGLLMIPQGVGTLATRSIAGRLSDTTDARWLALIGFLVTGLGTVPFAFATAHTDVIVLMAALLVRGAGLGVVLTPLLALGFRGLPREDVPDASIITRIAQQVGGSFGTAILTVVLTGSISAGGAAAFHHAFWWATGMTAVGLLVCLALPATSGSSPTPEPLPSE